MASPQLDEDQATVETLCLPGRVGTRKVEEILSFIIAIVFRDKLVKIYDYNFQK